MIVTRFRAGLLATTLLLPVTARAQRPAGDRLTWRDDLLAADRAAADSAPALGLADALARVAATEFVLVYPGAPVIAGRDTARRMMAAQDALKPLTVRWVPLFAEVSSDGTFGVSYGVTGISTTSPGVSLRFGKYLSAWRLTPDGWRLVAHAQIGLLPPTAFRALAQFRKPGVWALPPGGPVGDFARADIDFSTLAGRDGAAAAFAAFAAADAVLFPGSGELARGPDAIRRVLSGGPPSAWRWNPVAGDAAASGDLGFTVGEASITAQGETPVYTKYLSLWRREQDGRIRFIADGGNLRPAPGRP